MPRPRRLLAAGEIPRAVAEMAAFRRERAKLLEAPRSDGDPVLVLPGFTAGDRSTTALRRLLRELGYHVHAWRLGRNWGPTDRVIDGLRGRMLEVMETHQRPINLIGHSLGGIYAREITRQAPQAVRQVITLGSPARPPEETIGPGASAFQALSPLHSRRTEDFDASNLADPIPVPLTAIFTRADGVVPWRSCLVAPGPQAQNIEVRGSHSGLIHNIAAVRVILDRLASDPTIPYRQRPGIGARIWDHSPGGANGRAPTPWS